MSFPERLNAAIEQTWDNLAELQTRKLRYEALMARKNTLTDRVLFVMNEIPETADNLQFLCGVYWNWFDDCEHVGDIRFATSVESIARTRRRIAFVPSEDPSNHPDEFPDRDDSDEDDDDDDFQPTGEVD